MDESSKESCENIIGHGAAEGGLGGQRTQQPPLMKMQRPPGPMGYGMGGPRGGMGLPRVGMMGGPRGGMQGVPRGGHPMNPMMNQGPQHMPGLQPRPNGPGLQPNLPLASGKTQFVCLVTTT